MNLTQKLFSLKKIFNHISELKSKIWTLIFFLSSCLLYVFFKELIICWLTEQFFDQSFLTSIKWNAFYDGIIILIWLLLIVQNVIRSEAPRFNLADYVILIFILYNLFTGDWMYIHTKILPSLKYVHLVTIYYILLTLCFFYKRFSINKNSQGYLDLDIPISIDDEDLIKRKRIAAHIFESINLLRPTKALVIGLSGSWGKGKSSLVNLLKNEVERSSTAQFLQYSPWMYADSGALVTGFLNFMENNIHGSSGEFHHYKKTLLAAEDKLLGTSISSLITNLDSDFEKTKERINALLRRSPRLYVVSIDDLDRLTGEEVINVFKLIRSVADFTNVIYIVAYDRNYIQKVLEDIIPQGLTGAYLEKMLQVEFSIPDPEPKVVVKILLNNLESKLMQFFEKHPEINAIRVYQTINDMKGLQEKEFLTVIIKTLRDVKRFSNNLLIRYFSIYRDIDFIDLFYLELIRYRNQESYENILMKRHDILRTLVVPYIGLTRTESILKSKEMDDLIYKGQEEIKSLFQELTTTRSNALYPFFNKLFFDRYFSLDHYSHQISEADCNNLIDIREEAEMATALSKIIENGAEEDFNYKIFRMPLSRDQTEIIIVGCIETYVKLYKLDHLPSINRAAPYLAVTCLKCFFEKPIDKKLDLLRSIYKKSGIGEVGYLSYFLQGFTDFPDELQRLLRKEGIKVKEFDWIRRCQILLFKKLLRSKQPDIESLVYILIKIRWFIPIDNKAAAEQRFYNDIWLNPGISRYIQQYLFKIFQWVLNKCSLKAQSGEIVEGRYSSKFAEIYFDQIFFSETSINRFSDHRLGIDEFLLFIHQAKEESKNGNELVEFKFTWLKQSF